MTGHAIAKIDRIEKAATDAGLIGGAWTDITWALDIVNDVYGLPKEAKPVMVRHDMSTMERALFMCYQPAPEEPAAKSK